MGTLRKTVDPPYGVREFRFGQAEFKALLGIKGGRDVLRVALPSLARGEAEVIMSCNADGSRDHYFIDVAGFRARLGLPAGYRPFIAYAELTFPLARRRIKVVALSEFDPALERTDP